MANVIAMLAAADAKVAPTDFKAVPNAEVAEVAILADFLNCSSVIFPDFKSFAALITLTSTLSNACVPFDKFLLDLNLSNIELQPLSES
jgi:hypothetical protein